MDDTFATVLRYGMRGNRVRLLQQTLNSVMGETLVPDGVFGKATLGAVKRAQKNLRMNQTGEVDIKLALQIGATTGTYLDILYIPKSVVNKGNKEHRLPVAVSSKKDIIAKFGDCFGPHWDDINLVSLRLPGELFYDGQERLTKVNTYIDESILKCVDEMIKAGLKFTSYDGCVNKRYIRGSTMGKLSTHAWGIALDFDAAINPIGAEPRMNPKIVEIWERNGFIWGGRFTRQDGMHFQAVKGY